MESTTTQQQVTEKNRPKKIGLAFAGGGAKGAYQIGVWKAFQLAGISIDAIAGTSIGAFNATLLIGGDYDNAKDTWMRFSISSITKFGQYCLLASLLIILQPFGQVLTIGEITS